MELVSLFLLLALFCMQTAAFRRSALRSSLRMTSTDVNVQQTTTTATSAIQKGKKWPGTRPPIVNLRFRQLKMDASWGRGKFREEIWEDEINPANDWWNNFAPSEEEIEAATLGYDFQNPKAYFEVRGINFEAAKKEAEDITQQRLEAFLVEEKQKRESFSMVEFEQVAQKYEDMKRIAFEVEFRKRDNELQKKKGQASLDEEDTGTQWHNDPR